MYKVSPVYSRIRVGHSWLRDKAPSSGFRLFLLAQKTGGFSVISVSQPISPSSSSNQLGAGKGTEASSGSLQCTVRSAGSEKQLEVDAWSPAEDLLRPTLVFTPWPLACMRNGRQTTNA